MPWDAAQAWKTLSSGVDPHPALFRLFGQAVQGVLGQDVHHQVGEEFGFGGGGDFEKEFSAFGFFGERDFEAVGAGLEFIEHDVAGNGNDAAAIDLIDVAAQRGGFRRFQLDRRLATGMRPRW